MSEDGKKVVQVDKEFYKARQAEAMEIAGQLLCTLGPKDMFEVISSSMLTQISLMMVGEGIKGNDAQIARGFEILNDFNDEIKGTPAYQHQ